MARLPKFLPELATLVKRAPEGDDWLHELKYDGYRIGCRIEGGSVTLLSRNGKDWTDAFPEIVAAAKQLGVTHALLDGEVAIVLPDGRTSFQALQNAFSGESRAGLTYFVFDLLFVDGEDLRGQPLDARKRRLEALRGITRKGRIRFSEHVTGRGDEFFREACRLGLEGIVSKRRDSPYQTGRKPDWVKTKCIHRQEFVIGGFTDPEGSRQGIGSVLAGYYASDGRLTFAGKVGTGFTQASARDLRAKLEELSVSTSPFDPTPPGWLGRNAHWARPELVGEVVFTEWTDEGKIRHPSFQGLRADKRPRDVHRETEAQLTPEPIGRTSRQHQSSERSGRTQSSGRTRSRRVTIASVSISHPDRVLFSAVPMTKAQLAEYYVSVADWILPHLQDRPLTLVRCPTGASGECFYMKHSKVWAPSHVRRVRIQEKTKLGEYLVVDTIEALVSLVQMDVLEVHTWNACFAHVEQPDRLIFDIDPGPEVQWPQVVDAARLVRKALTALDLDSFVKTTGGAGLHVVVPIRPEREWGECLAFARAFSERLVDRDPDLYTTTFAKAGRERKILIDYLRNNRTNTSIAAFSTRAKAAAPVSVPIDWNELARGVRSDQFTVLNIGTRLRHHRRDPWRDYWTCRQRISSAAYRAVVDSATSSAIISAPGRQPGPPGEGRPGTTSSGGNQMAKKRSARKAAGGRKRAGGRGGKKTTRARKTARKGGRKTTRGAAKRGGRKTARKTARKTTRRSTTRTQQAPAAETPMMTEQPMGGDWEPTPSGGTGGGEDTNF